MQTPGAANYYNHDRSGFLDWVGGKFERVLDVGCGTGSSNEWYRRHGARQVVGVELDKASASKAALVLDEVVEGNIETSVQRLIGPFDLIVCADVLEHLVDPWAVVTELTKLAATSTVLAVSMPNIRFLPAVARIAVGRGFDYEDQGIFDKTHLRFFTRNDLDRLLRSGGWAPERWGAQQFGKLRGIRHLAARVSRGRSDDWLAEQVYAVARPAHPR